MTESTTDFVKRFKTELRHAKKDYKVAVEVCRNSFPMAIDLIEQLASSLECARSMIRDLCLRGDEYRKQIETLVRERDAARAELALADKVIDNCEPMLVCAHNHGMRCTDEVLAVGAEYRKRRDARAGKETNDS